MRKNKKGLLPMTAGLLLLAAALGLTGYNFWDENRASASVESALQQIDEQIPEDLVYPEEMIPDYLLNPKMDMPEIEIDGNRYIGRLDVPPLELSLPVMSSWSYPQLKIAPCRYEGSAYLDNLIIAAHNYERHFGTLKTLNSGDEVLFTDVDGNVFRYRVELLEQLEPTDIERMTDEGWDLTLFTCTLGGQYRVTVRCTRVEETPPLPALA